MVVLASVLGVPRVNVPIPDSKAVPLVAKYGGVSPELNAASNDRTPDTTELGKLNAVEALGTLLAISLTREAVLIICQVQ